MGFIPFTRAIDFSKRTPVHVTLCVYSSLEGYPGFIQRETKSIPAICLVPLC